MRSSRQMVIIVCVLTALLLPAVVYAAGPFYTSTIGNLNGTGAPSNPRLAADTAGLASACQYFGPQLTAGGMATLYWINYVGNTSIYYTYTLQSNGTCVPVGSPQPGYPPGFGVTLSPPVVIGGLLALGVVLMGAAALLRKWQRPGVRLT